MSTGSSRTPQSPETARGRAGAGCTGQPRRLRPRQGSVRVPVVRTAIVPSSDSIVCPRDNILSLPETCPCWHPSAACGTPAWRGRAGLAGPGGSSSPSPQRGGFRFSRAQARLQPAQDQAQDQEGRIRRQQVGAAQASASPARGDQRAAGTFQTHLPATQKSRFSWG